MKTEIGKFIKVRRKIKKLSIRQLAEAWRLETGERKKHPRKC